ncbi:MAG: tetratricopeptide repeat protein [Myxococcota bacterium]|nr:tetratricopeptide repeat protein [Myxococcota bacterium]
MGADEISSLLVKLQANPEDLDTRRRAAEALDASGKLDEAVAVLAPLINVTGHDEDVGLPCLCSRCLAAAPAAAESEGMKFSRSFAVTNKRVLHFWMLAELEHERAAVRESVAIALEQRLAHVKAAARR